MAFQYPNRPVFSIERLARTLGVSVEKLVSVSNIADNSYRLAKRIEKPDGSFRQPFDALEPLKGIHRRIQTRFLSQVVFPDFITGSVKGKDQIANARIHVGARTIVCEDVQQFFPSTTEGLVEGIWKGFFGFGHPVAALLTKLTCKSGALPQGAITSSYLANLAFWQREMTIWQLFADRGISYSRYVDDVTVSAKRPLSPTELTWAIATIYGMMRSCGYSAKRTKHEIARSSDPMTATKLLVNRKPSLPKNVRSAIRAEVNRLLKDASAGAEILPPRVNSTRGKVARLSRLHPAEGAALQRRMAVLMPPNLLTAPSN